MWDKLNKVAIRHIIGIIIVICCFALLFLLTMKEIPKGNEKLLDILIGAVIGSTLTPVIGWLFTSNKNDKSNQP